MFNDRRIAPCLWFDGNAEEAVAFYTSVFPNSKIRKISHYSQARDARSAREDFLEGD